MTSQLPHFMCLFLSCQQQKNTENGVAVMTLRSFLFCDDFSRTTKVFTSGNCNFLSGFNWVLKVVQQNNLGLNWIVNSSYVTNITLHFVLSSKSLGEWKHGKFKLSQGIHFRPGQCNKSCLCTAGNAQLSKRATTGQWDQRNYKFAFIFSQLPYTQRFCQVYSKHSKQKYSTMGPKPF